MATYIFGKRLAPLLLSTVIAALTASVSAQSASETAAVAKPVTQIDLFALKKLLKPAGKPRLINFWATWCDPCREEYPELVKIDQEYRGRIDFLIVSLDDLADKDTAVPKFLAEMKAEMPAYILITPDEEGAIAAVSKDWNGALPLTILFDEKGGISYFRQGKVKIDVLKSALAKMFPAISSTP